ncbi:MAG: undecaprenyl-diphosphate phosphatase [Caldisericia bacterium]|nr:undecaprenyl-diphosphate phosphatase [Caldisericia bacterium]
MTIFQAVIMAFAQGITEFLPISSSGHLAVIPFIFNFQNEISLSFDILLHMATLIAVVIFLWKDIVEIFKGMISGKKDTWVLVLKIILAIVPAAIVGLLFKDQITKLFFDPKLVGFAYFGTAALLFLTFFLKDGDKGISSITWGDCLMIGIFQAFALIPGFSRSGFTLVGAILIGMKSLDAFKFSFLISIPAILGAFILEIGSIESTAALFSSASLIAFFVAVVVGLGALWILKWILKMKKLYWFGFYCVALGIMLIATY